MWFTENTRLSPFITMGWFFQGCGWPMRRKGCFGRPAATFPDQPDAPASAWSPTSPVGCVAKTHHGSPVVQVRPQRASHHSFFPPLGGGNEGDSWSDGRGVPGTPSHSPVARGRVLL